MEHEREFHFSIQGELKMKETLNFTLSVNPSGGGNPLVVKDAQGNVLADGANVSLQPETVGTADPGQQLFTVSGGTAPYNFSISGGAPPAGVSLNSTINADGSETVSLSGTPTAAGAASFSIDVSDSASPAASARLGVRKIG